MKTSYKNLDRFSLVDPHFSKPGEIDLLLGGDVYGAIVLPQHHKRKALVSDG